MLISKDFTVKCFFNSGKDDDMPLATLATRFTSGPSNKSNRTEPMDPTPNETLECQVIKASHLKEPIVVKAEQRDSQEDEELEGLESPSRSPNPYQSAMRKSPKTLNPRVQYQSPIRKAEIMDIKDSPSDCPEELESQVEQGLILKEIESVKVVKWIRGLVTEVTIQEQFGEINEPIPRIDALQGGPHNKNPAALELH